MGLTFVGLQNANPRQKAYKVYDSGGLYAIVATSGSKLWRFDYRHAGKRKTLAFGQWPAVSLKQARDRRDEARALIDVGRDPAAPEPANEPARSDAPTFETMARRWFASKTSAWVSSYSVRIMSRLEGDIFPAIGDMPINAIEPPTLLAAIRQIEDRGAIELAKRVKNYCGDIFRFGIAEGVCSRDPSADIRSALKPKPRTKHRASLRLQQMPEFMAALAGYDGDTVTRQALLFTVLTAVRTKEARFATWSEIEGDVWRIPGPRMKMSAEHLVPLSKQVQALLVEVPRGDGLIFRSATGAALSENTMLYALYRLGAHGRATVHGFRSTFSTAANESGLWNPDAVERQLAHVEQNEVRRAYNAALHIDERRRLMQWWADQVLPTDEFAALLG